MIVRGGLLSIFALVSCVACGDVNDPSQGELYADTEKNVLIEADHFALIDGTPDAVGVLNLVNDENTTLETLDIEAQLDIRAARGIIHHRNGPDGILGTRDDELFETIEELDAVKWVSGRAIQRLVRYSSNAGFVPVGTDHLGKYDGVAFTVAEAEATVDFVNALTFEQLDDLLNRRSAEALFESGPYASIREVANVRYVGEAAMRILKNHATPQVQQQK